MKARSSFRALAGTVFIMVLTGAFSGIVEFREDFEGASGWFASGAAGFDLNRGLAHGGRNNGWVRNSSGWSAVNSWFTLPHVSRSATCTAEAWIRMSPTVTDGYFSVRRGDTDTPGPVIGEIRLRGTAAVDYRRYAFTFRPTGRRMMIYVGNWGNAHDPWLQVDDVAISCGRIVID
jgi:hypothetical protein